jgi:hypothetical protein
MRTIYVLHIQPANKAAVYRSFRILTSFPGVNFDGSLMFRFCRLSKSEVLSFGSILLSSSSLLLLSHSVHCLRKWNNKNIVTANPPLSGRLKYAPSLISPPPLKERNCLSPPSLLSPPSPLQQRNSCGVSVKHTIILDNIKYLCISI